MFLIQEEYHSNISLGERLTCPCQVKARTEKKSLWCLNYRSIIGSHLDGVHVKLWFWRTPLVRSCLPGYPRKSVRLLSLETLPKLIRFVETLSRMGLPDLWALVLLNFWRISHISIPVNLSVIVQIKTWL